MLAIELSFVVYEYASADWLSYEPGLKALVKFRAVDDTTLLDINPDIPTIAMQQLSCSEYIKSKTITTVKEEEPLQYSKNKMFLFRNNLPDIAENVVNIFHCSTSPVDTKENASLLKQQQ